MQPTIDRRAARTRKSLADALLKLILRKDYESISVQDIIDEADVGRSTFYMHYTGKEDLLRARFDALRSALDNAAAEARTVSASQPLPFSRALFEHACENKHVYRALVGGRGGVVANRQMRVVLTDFVRRELKHASDDGIPEEIRVRFVVDTFLGVLSWSLGHKPALPPARMDEIFRKLAGHGLG